MTSNIKLSPEEIQAIIADKNVRVNLAKQSCLWFSSIYFSHYFTHDFAQFHYDLFNLASQQELQLLIAIMFRGSGKSTIMTTIYPLYALFGKPGKKLIVIVSQTADLARTHMKNIKSELENNKLLKEDLGPFKEVDNLWNAQAIELPQQNAMIMAISIDQSIRGLRYKQHRPDLIICDDIEDSQSVKTEEGRRRTQELYSSEIAPLGDLGTQIVMVGNYLHPNGLLSKLKTDIDEGKIRGKALFVPLINADRQIAWPQKFPTLDDVYKLKALIADEIIWLREYELRIVADFNNFYTFENISFYDDIPGGWEPYFQYRIIGVDLAISKEVGSDFTAMVTADVYLYEDTYHIFILPNPINKKLSFLETCAEIERIGRYSQPKPFIYVEDTSFQRSFVEELLSRGTIAISTFSTKGKSKQERLSLTALWHHDKQIHFPRQDAELLINQLIGFGREPHDDLVDAYSMLVIQVQEMVQTHDTPRDPHQSEVQIVNGGIAWPRVSIDDEKMDLRTLKHDPWGWD